ncbi:MAG: hypothetical protein DYG86_01400 [Chloroflexi bacterium CFX2]|nr:hypothetical protein [Chloroflexi bacterium CFX2]
MKKKKEEKLPIYPQEHSSGFVVYVTINDKTYIVGEYETTKKGVAMRLAQADLATMLGLRAFPTQPNDPRPFLALSIKDRIAYYSSEHRDVDK